MHCGTHLKFLVSIAACVWFTTVHPLVTMKSYGGLFHCIPYRRSIRWLLLMRPYEKPPCIIMVAMVSCIYLKSICWLCGKPNCQCTKCKRWKRIVQDALVFFREPALSVSLSSFCSIYLGRVWFPRQASRVPPVKHKECKWLMRVSTKREQMLSETLWWFPPQICPPSHPTPPHPRC